MKKTIIVICLPSSFLKELDMKFSKSKKYRLVSIKDGTRAEG
ncbi:hypothetical protein [Clostridium sp. Cult3]|nr:hypothetical protein [Clostridium sp. Cult3]